MALEDRPGEEGPNALTDSLSAMRLLRSRHISKLVVIVVIRSNYVVMEVIK